MFHHLKYLFVIAMVSLIGMNVLHAQAPGKEAESSHPWPIQFLKHSPSQPVKKPVKRKWRKRKHNVPMTSIFSDLFVKVTRNPSREAGYLVTISFDSELGAYLHVNVINDRNHRIAHSEVYRARRGNNLLLLDIGELRRGSYRILISKGNQYVKSNFIKI